jgi:dephospho-CoA kinase
MTGAAEPMLQVGLTGNAASGKSTVARLWTEDGVPVVSADALARDAVAPGTYGLARVVEAFGPGVLGADGTLDRGVMRRRILEDAEARARLEGILHPMIAELRARWIEARRAEGHRLVVSEIPLLFEAGLEDTVDRIVLVDAPRAALVRRLVEDRGLSPGEAERLLDAQMDPAARRPRAHHVIENDADLGALRARAARVLAALRREAGS